jgi:hypothetical protein
MKSQFIIAALLVMVPGSTLGAQDREALPPADIVIAKMLARNTERQKQLAGYRGMRRYVLQNDRFKKHAEMVVRVEGDADETKHFEVVHEEGWQGARKHVLYKMLKSEEEASAPRIRILSQLNADNYALSMLGTALIDNRMAYVIDVSPRRLDEHLFEGRIWIDGQDYALTRVEGRPAKNPSFWIRSVHFTHMYRKCGTFWFPLSTESVSQARIFGTTSLTITYFDYTPHTLDSRETASAAPRGGAIQ